MERNNELEKQLESASKAVLKLIRKIAKKLKMKDKEIVDSLQRDFDYCWKIYALLTSADHVFFAYEYLSDRNEIPSATESVKNCLKELSTKLSETLAEKGTHE